MAKRPSFQFYPGDWLQDSALRCVSVGARGLWIDMLCLMHQGTPYGHLTINGKGLKNNPLARMEGVTVSELEGLLKELDDAGVYSTTDEGVIYSRRMVRDEALRELRAEGGPKGAEHGKKGGRPRLEKPLDGDMEGVGEGVMEGVNNKPLTPSENNPPSSSSSSSSSKIQYTVEFEEFWTEYPRKLEKVGAYKCWNARLKEGHTATEMIEGAKCYAEYCRGNGNAQKHIKHAKSFLGPEKHFIEYAEFNGKEPAVEETNHLGEKAPPGMKWDSWNKEWIPADTPDLAM